VTEKVDLDKLRRRVVEVFPKVEPLGLDELTGHRCEECDELRDLFFRKKWWELDREVVRENYGQLSLFQPKTYKYYLPAFILEALDNFNDSDEVLEFFIYGWLPSKYPRLQTNLERKRSIFDIAQMDVIADVLRAVVEDPQMIYSSKDAETALRFISS
jgi:hypothetical protein